MFVWMDGYMLACMLALLLYLFVCLSVCRSVPRSVGLSVCLDLPRDPCTVKPMPMQPEVCLGDGSQPTPHDAFPCLVWTGI